MKLFAAIISFFLPVFVMGQTYPSVEPSGTYYKIDDDGDEESGDVNGTVQSAPIRVEFLANPSGLDGYGEPRFEWKVFSSKAPQEPMLIRNEENFEYEFRQSGSFTAQLKVTFYDENGEVFSEFPEEGEDAKLIVFTVSESQLEFPNAFSPNGDGYNDVLRAKDDYKSIVSFEAAVFSRWGKKLYSWSDVRGGWDGKVGGKPAKDGIYYLVVNAKGADGRDFKIKKTITVITGYNNGEEGSAALGD